METIKDLEFNKFVNYGGKNVVAVLDYAKQAWSTIGIARPSDSVEVYTFKDSNNVVLDEITITYTDSSKSDILTVSR